MSGWWTSVENLGEVIGSSIGGALIDYYDFNVGTNIVASWCVLVSIVIGLYYATTIICRSACRKRSLRKSMNELDEETSFLIRSNFFKRKRSTFKDVLKWTLEGSDNGQDELDPIFRRSAGYKKVDNDNENDAAYYLTI